MNSIDSFSHKPSRSGVAPEPRDDTIDILAFFRMLRRRIALIVGLVILVTLAALPLILGMEKLYYAESRLLIQPSLAAPEPTATAEIDVSTEVERLWSRDIAERVIRDLELIERAEFNGELRPVSPLDELRATARGWIGIENGETEEAGELDRIVPEFLSRLSVRRNGLSAVVQIGFTSEDPALAAEVPNTLLRVYFDEREEKLRNRVKIADEYLGSRVAEQRKRVASALEAAKKFRETTGVLSSDFQNQAAEAVTSLTRRSVEILGERTELSAIVATMEGGTGTLIEGDVASSEALASLARQHDLQEADLARLLGTYGENHEAVVEARSKIAETESAIAAESQRHGKALQARLEMLEREDVAVREALLRARETLSAQSLSASELAGLERTAERERAALEALEERRRAIVAQVGVPLVEAEILSPATLPLASISRSRLLVLIGTVVAAGFVAVTVACILELLDGSIRSSQQMDPGLNTASAGLLPRLSRRAVADLFRANGKITDRGFFEAILGVMLALENHNAGVPPGSILVTSALPDEGKSLVALGIARGYAAAGRRVLLLDFSRRNDRVWFGKRDAGSPGISELLMGHSELAAVTRSDDGGMLNYIPWGNFDVHPLHARTQIRKLVDTARGDNRIVIIDAPPALVATEAAALAGVTETVLLVIRWGKTGRRAVTSAVCRLQAGARDSIMVAMNIVQPRRHLTYGFEDADTFDLMLKRARKFG